MKRMTSFAIILFAGTASFAGPDADGLAGFSTDWHGHGNDHQANNDPGDTAADRHGFNNADAGKSGKSPAAGDKAGKKG